MSFEAFSWVWARVRIRQRPQEIRWNGSLAQLNRAFDYGSKGYRFESYWDHEASEFYSGAFSCFSVTNIL